MKCHYKKLVIISLYLLVQLQRSNLYKKKKKIKNIRNTVSGSNFRGRLAAHVAHVIGVPMDLWAWTSFAITWLMWKQ